MAELLPEDASWQFAQFKNENCLDPSYNNIAPYIDSEINELIDYAKVPENIKKNLTTRIKIISGMNITEFRLPQDGAIKKINENGVIDISAVGNIFTNITPGTLTIVNEKSHTR